jgi:DNA-binding Lrp family transcriptional regulator
MRALDRIDYQIVRLLRNNARLSNKEIAEKVGLAPSTCLVRTRMLQQSGAITGFKAEVDPAALGVGLQAMIAVRLKRHYKPDVEAFRSHAMTAFTSREEVSHIETELIFEHVSCRELPAFLNPGGEGRPA